MVRLLIGGTCEVLIGAGLFGDFLPERPGRARVAVLGQPGSAGLARRAGRGLRAAGLGGEVRILPDREEAKTLETAAGVYEWLIGLGLGRDDTLLAVGGGALTDLAGFVAATYLRGIEAVYCPTTLVAAVDAAIGGKTGLNLGGKNLVGVFRHPARVVVDTDLLADLPGPLMREGLAEALKAGLVGDPGLVALFEAAGLQAPLEEVVRRAVAVKTRIVEEDFEERSGTRAFLNYGHTIGHALEVAARIPHGEAVAVGMVAAGEASTLVLGFDGAGRQRRVIERLGLPVRLTGADPARVRALLDLDKKRDAAGLRMVLLRAIGDPVLVHVDSPTVDAALDRAGIGA